MRHTLLQMESCIFEGLVAFLEQFLVCLMCSMMRLLFMPAGPRRDTPLTQGRHHHHKIAESRWHFQIRPEPWGRDANGAVGCFLADPQHLLSVQGFRPKVQLQGVVIDGCTLTARLSFEKIPPGDTNSVRD
jgi:hypothetical protein